MSDKEQAEGAPKKKGKLGKIIVMAVGGLVLVGGGVGAGLYAAGSGLVGAAHAEDPNKPKLVPKGEEKRAAGGEAELHLFGREIAQVEGGQPVCVVVLVGLIGQPQIARSEGERLRKRLAGGCAIDGHA